MTLPRHNILLSALRKGSPIQPTPLQQRTPGDLDAGGLTRHPLLGVHQWIESRGGYDDRRGHVPGPWQDACSLVRRFQDSPSL